MAAAAAMQISSQAQALRSLASPAPQSVRGLASAGLRVCLPAARTSRRRVVRRQAACRGVVTCDGGPNFFLELFGSAFGGALAGAAIIATSEKRDAEIERIQTLDGALPYIAALGVDTVAHSIPGLNILFQLLTEPAGAAVGVAYVMTLVLSSPKVDPKTLAPAGTVLNAEKAEDMRSAVRVPFTQIIPTALKVVDFSNEFSSGKGWTVDKDGLPRLPVTSVLIVLGVGGIILETLAHAPVLSLVLPRALTFATWLAAAGYFLDKRSAEATSS